MPAPNPGYGVPGAGYDVPGKTPWNFAILSLCGSFGYGVPVANAVGYDVPAVLC